MSRRLTLALSLLAVLAGGIVAWWASRPALVPAVILQAAPLVRTLQFSGRVATLSRVDVGSTVTGRVLQVMVSEGAQVAMGDVLVRMESDELSAALAQAQAGEQQALARLQGLRSTGRRVTQAAVAQAGSVLRAAQAELQRTQDLVAKGFVSEARLDESQRGAAVALAQFDSARAQNEGNAERGTELVQAQAQLKLASAAAVAARARLAQATVIAPADAKVLSRLVEPGQIVQPGRSMFSLALAGPFQLVAQIDERYLEQLEVGQTAGVLADAFADRRFVARVQSIAPVVDAQRGAVEVKFSLQAPVPAFLREDMTLSVEVETASRESALAIPMDALHPDSSGAGAVVFTARDGRVTESKVRLGLRTIEAAEVLDGLAAGDVVLKGVVPKTGSRIRVDMASQALVPPRKVGSAGAASAMTNAVGR